MKSGPGRLLIAFCLLIVVALKLQCHKIAFFAPSVRQPCVGECHGSLAPAFPAAHDTKESLVPRQSYIGAATSVTFRTWPLALVAFVAVCLQKRSSRIGGQLHKVMEYLHPRKLFPLSQRRAWMGVNVVNHGIYAALFVIRSLFYTGVGSSDRPFYYESFFLGWLCGPSAFIPTLFGWPDNHYQQPAVLAWMTKINSASSTAYPAWMTGFISNPAFMYYYQIAEGTFHFMIVFGGLRALLLSSKKAWPPREGSRLLKTYRLGLWLELIIMDVAYVIAYTCLPMMSVPGHWGLTTIMMLIHHLNVLPDVVCAYHEWKASKAAKQVINAA